MDDVIYEEVVKYLAQVYFPEIVNIYKRSIISVMLINLDIQRDYAWYLSYRCFVLIVAPLGKFRICFYRLERLPCVSTFYRVERCIIYSATKLLLVSHHWLLFVIFATLQVEGCNCAFANSVMSCVKSAS